MTKHLPIFLCCMLLLLGGCSSGKKSLERGNYYDAVLKSIKRLRKNPSHKKSIATLREGYPYAVDWLETEAQNTLSSNAPFKWKRVLSSYNKINRMHDEIKRSPGARKVIRNPKNYFSEIADIKQKAAEESYEAGLAEMAKDTRESAKRAYYHFLDAKSFVPGYKDVNDMIPEARFVATLKVVIEQIPVPTRYTLSGNFFQDRVEEFVHRNIKNEFVRFYTPNAVKTEKLPYVDHIMRIRFDDFVVGRTHVVERIEEVSKDSVVVGSITLESGKKADVFNTVKAKMTTFKKEVISTGLVSMRVVDAKSNAVLSHRKFNGNFVWFSEWGTFNGDERALTDQQLSVCKSKEVPPPPPQDLFIEFTKPIYGQLTTAINNFYRGF